MAKIESKSFEICLVCAQYMGNFKNDLSVRTSFSERLIYEIFGNIFEMKTKTKSFNFLKKFFSRGIFESKV